MESNYLALYNRCKEVDIPCDISDRSKYLFTLVSKFADYDDAAFFALSKSGLSRPYYMYCVFNGLEYAKDDPLIKYYVYSVISFE